MTAPAGTIALSICIATYNRARFIGETLETILAQLRPGVELLVVDGASTDDTAAVVTARFHQRAGCRYVRLPAKGGVDQDYCRAVELATGAHCWLMTDDDVLLPDAVDRVLGALAGGHDLLVVNAEVAGPDLAATLVPRKIRVDEDRAFGPGEGSALLALAGEHLSFIGAVVVRRSTWLARDPRPFFGTEFVHVGVLFSAPLARGARVIAAPLVRIRYGNAQWSARAFAIWMFQWPQLIWQLPGLDDAARAAVTPREPWRRSFALLLMKAKGCYSLAEYRRYLQPLPIGWTTRLRLVALAAFPEIPFNRLLRALLPIVAPRARGTLVDLAQSRFNPGRDE